MRCRPAPLVWLALSLSLAACNHDAVALDSGRNPGTGTRNDAEPEQPEDASTPEPEGGSDLPESGLEEADGGLEEPDTGVEESDTGAAGPDDGGALQDVATEIADADAASEAGVDASGPWDKAAAWTDEDTQAAFAYRCGVRTVEDSSVFLDVGYTKVAPMGLALYGERLLIDSGGAWSLWQRSDRTRIAKGEGGLLAHGAQAFASYEGGNLVLRSMLDGHPLLTRSASELGMVATASGNVWNGGLARDGSYLWYRENGNVRAVGVDGALWLDEPVVVGNSVNAQATRLIVRDDSGRLRIYPRSGGAPTTIMVPGNAFPNYSADGSRYFLHDGATTRLYEVDGTLVGSANTGMSAPSGSIGDWLWVVGGVNDSVSLYRVGNDTPVLTLPNVYGTYPRESRPWAASASRLVLPGHVIDLTSGTELQTAAPAPRTTTALAADGTDWVTYGLNARPDVELIAEEGVRGSDGAYFGCGGVRNILIGDNGLAFATTERGVFVFDIATRSMRGFVRTRVSSTRGGQIAEDGSVLLLSDGYLQQNFAVFAIDPASGATPLTVALPGFPVPTSFVRLSPDGHWVGIRDNLSSLDTPPGRWEGTVGGGVPYANPSGTRAALIPGVVEPESWSTFPVHERSGTLLGRWEGAPMKWLSDDVLITGNLPGQPILSAIDVASGSAAYPGVSCPGGYRGIARIQRLGGTELYLPSHGLRCDIATGETSPLPRYRGVAPEGLFGDQALYLIGAEAAVRSVAP